MPIDTAQIRNMGQTAIASRAQGQQNRLLAEKAARDEQFRNLIAESIGPQAAGAVQTGMNNLLVPGAPSAQPQLSPDIMSQLMAIDPERAASLGMAQQQQRQLQRQAEQEKAAEVVQRMQFVLQSETPAQSLRLAGRMGGNDLIDVLAEQGIIDSSDGIDDDEARIIAQSTIETFGPLLQDQEPRASGLEGTFQALERRGVAVTPEMALQLAQATDSEVAALSAELGVQKSILDLERTRAQLAQDRSDAEQAGEDREAQRAQEQSRALGGAERILTAWESLDVVGASVIARPGFQGGVRSSVASALALVGLEDPKVASAAEQFNDIATISGAELLAELGLDPTDIKFQAITNASLSLDKSDETNRRQLQRLAGTVLDEIDGGRLEVPDSVIEKLLEIDSWDPSPPDPVVDIPAAALATGEAVRGAAESVAESVAEISRMTLDQLRNLDIRSLSDEAIDAAERRWEQINAGE